LKKEKKRKKNKSGEENTGGGVTKIKTKKSRCQASCLERVGITNLKKLEKLAPLHLLKN